MVDVGGGGGGDWQPASISPDLLTIINYDDHQLLYQYPRSSFFIHSSFPCSLIYFIYFSSLSTMSSQSFLHTQLRVSTCIPIVIILLLIDIITGFPIYNRLVLYCGQYSHFYAPDWELTYLQYLWLPKSTVMSCWFWPGAKTIWNLKKPPKFT